MIGARDTRLWCVHYIGPDDVYPAPDFETAQQWADYANTHINKGYEDISRHVVAVWPWVPEGHAEGLAKSITDWTLPTPRLVDQSDVEAAAKAHCDFFGGEGWWDTGLIADTKPKAIEAMRAAIAAMPTDPLVGEQAYLVWSNEHSAWWAPDRCGYTRIIRRAGRYRRDEALSIAGTRDGGWHVRKGNPDEIAIPERDAIDQYAAITREQEADTGARKSGGVSQP